MTEARPQRQARGPRGPFARPFDVRGLKGQAREIDIAATPEECAAVAEAIALPAIAALEATFRLVPRAGDRVDLAGTVRARVAQVCVVSLEPFEASVVQDVEIAFAPPPEPVPEPRARGDRAGTRRATAEPAMPAPVAGNDDQEDPPDPLIGDTIDLGSVAVEFMVLGLDPYPRKPGVHFDDTVIGEKGAPMDPPKPSAFAALSRLKDRS